MNERHIKPGHTHAAQALAPLRLVFAAFARMITHTIHALTDTVEAHAQQTDGCVEFRLARDLQYLLGYTEWCNFTAVLSKA